MRVGKLVHETETELSRHVPVQAMILIAGAGAYWWYSLRYVGDHLFRPVIGTAAIIGAFHLSRKLGPIRNPGTEPLIGFALSVLLFAMPVASGPPPRGHGFVAADIGMFVAQGAWALYRYPYEPRRSARGLVAGPVAERVRTAVLVGVCMAVILTLYVAVILTIAAFGSSEARTFSFVNDFLLVSLGYLAAGVLGGAVIGVGAPLIRWPLGAMVMGIPLAGAIYGSVGAAMEHMEVLSEGMEPSTTRPLAGLLILIGIGPMWGLLAKGWLED